MKPDFVAIDVETANSDVSSICQIGIAAYKNGTCVDEWLSLINPEDVFDPFNTSIHGINENSVANAPTITDVYNELCLRLNGNIVVHHTHFDRASIKQALEKYELECISCTWLDSARVTRRTWPQFQKRDYGLKNVCAYLGYEFQHHNALEDAKAAAVIIHKACELLQLIPFELVQKYQNEINEYGHNKNIEQLTAGHKFKEFIHLPTYPKGARNFLFTIEIFDKESLKQNIDILKKQSGVLSFNMLRDEQGLYRIIHNSGLHIGYLPEELQLEISDLLNIPRDGFIYHIKLYQNINITSEDILNALKGARKAETYEIEAKLSIWPSPARFIDRLVKDKIISRKTANNLIEANYLTKKDIANSTDEELCSVKGVGKLTVKRMREFSFDERLIFIAPDISPSY